jgi:quercetin dioxygenase-like cupin family protein
MSEQETKYIEDIASLVSEIPTDSIISRTFHDDDQSTSILFAFAKGQMLSEHTAAKPAVLHFIKGTANLTLGEDKKTAKAGTWVHMPANLPHSVVAETEVLMILTMYKIAKA